MKYSIYKAEHNPFILSKETGGEHYLFDYDRWVGTPPTDTFPSSWAKEVRENMNVLEALEETKNRSLFPTLVMFCESL